MSSNIHVWFSFSICFMLQCKKTQVPIKYIKHFNLYMHKHLPSLAITSNTLNPFDTDANRYRCKKELKSTIFHYTQNKVSKSGCNALLSEFRWSSQNKLLDCVTQYEVSTDIHFKNANHYQINTMLKIKFFRPLTII